MTTQAREETDRERIWRLGHAKVNADILNGNSNGHKAPPAAPTIVTATDLMGMEFPEPRWAIPGILPAGLALLVGRPKQGKSWLLLSMGLAIAYGGKALGRIDVEQGDVLLLCLEDNQRRLQERMRMLLAGEPTPEKLHLTTEWPRLDQGGAVMLDNWLTEHPKTRMVGIDVLQRVRAKSVGEGHLYEQDYEAMRIIKKIADDHNTLIQAVHHTRKAPSDDPFDTISGTTGLGGGADTGMVLMRERSQADAVLYVRGRDVNEQELAMKFDGVTGQWNLLGDADTYRTTQERIAIIEALRDHGPKTPKEVALILNKKVEVIRNTLSRMYRAGEIDNTDGKYSVKPQVPWD